MDVGTTGCKLTSYDENGNLLYSSYRAYEVSRCDGEHEIDVRVIRDAVLAVIRDTAERHAIAAIGITTFGETFVLLDANDQPLLPAMLYTDPRGTEECAELCTRIGEREIIRIAGTKPHSMYSLPKLMWIKRNHPALFARAKRVLLIQDYLVYLLSGNTCIDYSLAARTMALDIRRKCWSEEILQAAEIDAALFSRPVPSGHIAGTLRAEFARELGIHSTVQIVSGAHDQVAAAIGAGILKMGDAVDGTGTVECITPVFDHIPKNEAFYEKGYSVVPYALDNTYACYAFSFTGGAAVKWYRDHFCANRSYAELDGAAPDAPTGLLILPHFAGAATPYMDNGAKAAIVGLTLEHTDADLYKAIMEGVTYEMLLNAEQLEHFGIRPQRLFATGGGAASDIWLQIKADVLGRPVTALLAKEAGACGTCMLVGMAMGLYPDLRAAKPFFAKERKTFLPRAEQTERYARYYQAYKAMYEAIRPILKEAFDA